MVGNAVPMVGSWQGEQEPSWIMRTDDFDRCVRDTHFVENQDAFMLVSECNKAYATLEWRDGYLENMGSMMSVPKDVAMQAPGYSYRPDIKTYWVCVDGNPDHVYGQPIPPFSQSIHSLDISPEQLAAE